MPTAPDTYLGRPENYVPVIPDSYLGRPENYVPVIPTSPVPVPIPDEPDQLTAILGQRQQTA